MSDILERAKQILASGEQPAPTNDFVGQAKAILEAGQARRLAGAPLGHSQTIKPVPNPGVVGSAVAGVKKGIAQSFFQHPGPTPGVDSAPEKVAEFLGNMAGLGIGFVPYSAATGIVLKGIGFAAPLVNPILYGFVRNTIAGAAQAAAMSENPEDRGRDALVGAALGGVVEGFFLAKAMRTRAPIPKLKGLGGPQLAKELAAAPAEGMPASVIQSTVEAMKPPEFNFDQVLADMAQVHETTMRIPLVANPEGIANDIRTKLPSTAQVIQSGDRVLIHNPVDPADALSQAQIDQWVRNDYFDGMQVIYNGKDFASTGVDVGEGRIQLRGTGAKRGLVFTARSDAVFLPINPKIFTKQALESEAKQLKLNTIAQKARQSMGFVQQYSANTVVRGVADVTNYVEASSFGQFARDQQPVMKLMSGLVGDTAEDLVYDYARKRGIPGLLVRDAGGTVTEVRVFDPSTLSYGQELPMIGIPVDKIVAGRVQGEVRGFIPSWKNTIAPALSAAGVPEKEIRQYLDLYAEQLRTKNNGLLSEDFVNRLQAAEKQYFEGCN